jgi:NAD(P)-dependent dehydrogenase (short-subunit alcohol dehydrogenase family)
MTDKVWFITGTSRGFGREWAEAALRRGDRVAATARDVASLKDLTERYGDRVLPLALDVTDKAAVDAVVQQAHQRFGRLDVIVNNAGYGLFGAIEETSEEQARAQLETNLFGPLWVTKAALPVLRAQGCGHIIQVSSISGVWAFGGLGLYSASKWGLEAFSASLAQEVEPFGIHVTLVEPTAFSTDWGGASSVRAEPIDAYQAARAGRPRGPWPGTSGDPAATSAAIMAVVDAEQPPLRLFLGEGLLPRIEQEYERRLATWREWNDVAERAHGAGS